MSFDALCIGSGGIKGILVLGALYDYWSTGQLKSIKHFAGTSVGSIIISLLVIGYSPMDIFVKICNPEFNNIFESPSISDIALKWGLYNSENLKEKIESYFLEKINKIPTFKEILEEFNAFLIIPSHCLTDNKDVYFTPESSPDMKVTDAIILSSSIPFVFQKTIYENKIYVDGAYTENFPINILKKHFPEDKILGFRILNSKQDLDSIQNYVYAVSLIGINSQVSNISETDTIIDLNSESNNFNFNINTVDKINMFVQGMKITIKQPVL